MKRLLVLFVGIILTAILSGCAPKSYVDEKYENISIENVQKVENTKIFVEVEFQRDGKHLAAVDDILRVAAEDALKSSGYLIAADKESSFSINITANNFGDTGKAALKGFGTGLTLGLVGSTVTDFYEVNISFNNGKSNVNKNYSHAIHTTIGNSKPVYENAKPLTGNDAFKKVIKDIVLSFIIDLQANKIN